MFENEYETNVQFVHWSRQICVKAKHAMLFKKKLASWRIDAISVASIKAQGAYPQPDSIVKSE
jgi:hypothetical protein